MCTNVILNRKHESSKIQCCACFGLFEFRIIVIVFKAVSWQGDPFVRFEGRCSLVTHTVQLQVENASDLERKEVTTEEVDNVNRQLKRISKNIGAF